MVTIRLKEQKKKKILETISGNTSEILKLRKLKIEHGSKISANSSLLHHR